MIYIIRLLMLPASPVPPIGVISACEKGAKWELAMQETIIIILRLDQTRLDWITLDQTRPD